MVALQIIGFTVLVMAICAGTLLFLIGGPRYRDGRRNHKERPPDGGRG